jgi:DNA-binding NtrC family response regulator
MNPEHPASVWIVDSQHWPRACLRAELIERGYDAVGFEEIDQALAAMTSAGRPRPRVIVVELRDQGLTPSILELLADSKVPAIALAGTLELNHRLVRDFNWTALLKRPVTLGSVADAIERVLADS